MQCPICQQNLAHLEEHHIIPREYGGESLETIDICSTCHRGLHNQATHIIAKQKSNGKIERYYFTQDIWPVASQFVSYIVEAHRNFHSVNSNNIRHRRIIVHVPDDLLLKLHLLKKYKGYSSLERFIRHLLEDLVKTM